MELNEKFVSELAQKLGVKAEVLKSVLSSEAKEDEVKSLSESLNAVHIFTDDELNARIANEKKEARNEGKTEGINQETGRVYGIMDKRIKEAFGVEKNPNEQTLDYLIRAPKESAPSAEELQALKKENEQLKKGTNDAALQKAIEENRKLSEKLQDKEKALANALEVNEKLETEKQGIEKRSKIESSLSSALSGFTPAENYGDANEGRSYGRYRLEQEFQFDYQDGREVVVNKATKEVVKNPKTGDPVDYKSFLSERFPKIVKLKEEPVPRGGAGLKPQPIPKNGLGDIDFSEYTNAKELGKHLQESGISNLSKEYSDTINAYLKSPQGKASIGAKPVNAN